MLPSGFALLANTTCNCTKGQRGETEEATLQRLVINVAALRQQKSPYAEFANLDPDRC